MRPWAKRVVLFGIDGAGTFFEQADTPNMDRIFRHGAVCRRVLTEIPTISAECWGSMLHGVDCQRHGLTNWLTGQRHFPGDSLFPSVFRVIREHRPEAVLASFCDWDNVNYGIIEENLGVHKVHARDCDLVQPAIEFIHTHDFTLMYFQFDSVDHEGHAHGYGSPEHLMAITRNDAYIGRIVESMEKCGLMEDTLILVEADHGGTPPDSLGQGAHGGDSDMEKYVCFFAAGGGVRHTELQDMLVRDTAPVMLYALGIPQPASWNSRVPAGLFPDHMKDLPRPEGLLPPVPAPCPKPEKGLFMKQMADLQPLMYLSFESMDSLPPHARQTGKLYLTEGIRGRGMRFDDGSLSLDFPLKGGSFSLTAWVRPDAAEGGVPLMSLHAPGCPSSVLDVTVTGEEHLMLTVRTSGNVSLSMDTWLPPQWKKTWMFLALSFDTQDDVAGLSLNFEPFLRQRTDGRQLFPECADFRLFLGMDGTEDPGRRLPGTMDDVCLYRGVLDQQDIARLKAYYTE